MAEWVGARLEVTGGKGRRIFICGEVLFMADLLLATLQNAPKYNQEQMFENVALRPHNHLRVTRFFA